jgi:site-specific recombinase XerD
MPSDYYPIGPFIGRRAGNKAFEAAREDFLLDCRTERTARAYKADLEDFREWCSLSGVDPLSPSEANLADYVRNMEHRGYSSGTVRRRAEVLGRFLRRLGELRLADIGRGET